MILPSDYDQAIYREKIVKERLADLAEAYTNLLEANATLRAEVAQLKAEAQQSEKIRAELETQLAGAARVLITVEQERDKALRALRAADGLIATYRENMKHGAH